MPKVEVEGVGVLSFPVPAAQIEEIIQQAVRAPYGRGEETILDTSGRDVWQLTPAKVRLGGKSGERSFQHILSAVAGGLGCDGANVSAELYMLLVYDEGGFFKEHRDTEKSDGMFGTLVIVLPSAHRGGELVIRHAGRETTVDLSGGEVSELAFAAFYALGGRRERHTGPSMKGKRGNQRSTSPLPTYLMLSTSSRRPNFAGRQRTRWPPVRRHSIRSTSSFPRFHC